MDFHSASAIFPLMDGVALAILGEDILAHGLLEPIVLYEGKVLDGRNRLRACDLVGVQPRFLEWQPDGSTPSEWVISMNLHRRHLTTGQRAALALDLLPHLEGEAKERQRGGQGGVLLSPETDEAKGRAVEKAADLVGVGRSTVAYVKAIQKRDGTGEVIDAMRVGELNVSQAARRVGFETGAQSDRAGLPTTRDARGADVPTVRYGRGDKWTASTVPLFRYLGSWAKRDYEFRHVNPGEAAKRIRTIDALIEGLNAARADLATRSTPARIRS